MCSSDLLLPTTVVEGMLAAIGIIIIVRQIPPLLGAESVAAKSVLVAILALPQQLATAQPVIALLGIASLAFMFLLNLRSSGFWKRLPAAIIVTLFGIAAGFLLDLGPQLRIRMPESFLDALHLPDHLTDRLSRDPRLVRLGLPAAVMTLIEVDPRALTLRFAHAGDTALLVAYTDGRYVMPVRQRTAFDGDLLRLVQRLRAETPGLSFRQAACHLEVQRKNLFNALAHNYVDEHGLPQPSRGIGVLDGLPELRYFVQTGEVSLEGALFVCVMTDGLLWPASAEEVFATDPAHADALRRERFAFMAGQIAGHGLRGYLAQLRAAEAADPDHERYPRLKTHDDATGVLLRFE